MDNPHPLDPALDEDAYPFAAHIGMALTGWGPDYARIELPIAAFIANRHGVPHGGVHAAMLDTAMGYAGCYTGDPDNRQLALTLSLNVNYLSQAQGARLIAEGRRTGGGRRTFFAEARLIDDTGDLIATGTGVFRYKG